MPYDHTARRAVEATLDGRQGAGQSLEDEVFELLSQHAMTNRQLAEWELFENEEASGRWTRRKRQKGLLFWAGCTVQFNGDKPQKVWTRGWEPKKNQGLHECLLTDALLTLDADRTERQHVDPFILPDGEVWFYLSEGTEHWFVELSTGPGSMTVHEIATTRYPKYRKTEDPVVWVCYGKTEAEAERWVRWMAKRARGMDHFFFTTTYWLIDRGDLAIVDADGKEARLPERCPEPCPVSSSEAAAQSTTANQIYPAPAE